MSSQANVKKPAPVYKRRKPETTVLYQVLQEHLATFLARVEADGPGACWPGFVKRELKAHLACGILAHGFCRLHCDRCGRDELVAFSCSGRGFCPSCGGRRMADTAAYLVDRLLPEQPIRQWVLTLPFRIRYRAAFDKKICAAVKSIFIRVVQSHLKRKARRRGITGGKPGAVVFVQRWGSALNLNVHFQALVLDGVYSTGTGKPAFHTLSAPTDEEVAELTHKIHARVFKRMRKEGIFQEESLQATDPLPFGSPELGQCYAASVQGRVGLGEKKGAFVTRQGRMKGAKFMEMTGVRCAAYDGFTLHANVSIHGRRRTRLERLCRYVARGAIATDRLSRLPDGRVHYRLRKPFWDGTRAVIFAPLTFIEKRAALIPPPRQNLVSYHGHRSQLEPQAGNHSPA